MRGDMNDKEKDHETEEIWKPQRRLLVDLPLQELKQHRSQLDHLQ